MLDVVHIATRRRLRRENTLLDAVKRDDPKCVRYLLSTGKHDVTQAMCVAIQEDKSRALRALLEGGSEIESDGHGSMFLYLAMKWKRLGMMDLLMQFGASPLRAQLSLVDQTVAACRTDNVVALGRILSAAPELASVRLWSGPAICEASCFGSSACVDALLECVQEVDAEDMLGFTASAYAVIQNKSITKLLKRGADPNKIVGYNSLLWYSIQAKNVDAFCELMQAGAVPTQVELDYCIKRRVPIVFARSMIGNETFGKRRIPTQCVRTYSFANRVSAWLCSKCTPPKQSSLFSELRPISEIDVRVWIADSVMYLNALSHDDKDFTRALAGMEYAIMACGYMDKISISSSTLRLTWLAALTLSFSMWDGYDVDLDVMGTMTAFASYFGQFYIELPSLVSLLFKKLGFRAWIQHEEYEKYRIKFE